MTMVFEFKTILLRNMSLGPFNLRVLELHHLLALTADQVIMMRLGTGAFIVSIATRPETLRHHARLQLAELRAAMEKEGLRAVGEPVWARYDPPFMPWFLRTNEILVEIAP